MRIISLLASILIWTIVIITVSMFVWYGGHIEFKIGDKLKIYYELYPLKRFFVR